MKLNTYAGTCSCGKAVAVKAGVVERGKLYCLPCHARFSSFKPVERPQRRRVFYPK